MKRNSILATAVLTVVACTAEARVHDYSYGYSDNRYRVRWSIHTHGLISGDLYYSPYAFGGGHSGLVPGDVRYSPYAFGHGRSGLVVDSGANYYSGSCSPHYDVRHYRAAPGYSAGESRSSHSHGHANVVRTPKICKETAETRKARRAELAQARREKHASRSNDGKEIIARYLKGRNIDFRMTRILSIEGKTISVDFLLNDGNTILKYWNPAEILSLGQPQGRRRKFYDKYAESWFGFCAEHLKAGGKIHQIISSDADEILARLPLCPDLSGVEKVYALATEPSP